LAPVPTPTVAMEALTKSLRFGPEADSPVERRAQARMLDRLVAGLELRIPGISAHSRRVSHYATGVALEMGFSRALVAKVRRAGELHDIGKVEMPADIVNKPGPLSREEFALVRRHPTVGARMVAPLGDEQLTAIVRHHHERFDGSGYPDGLSGKEIPLGARIVAVVDAFCAMIEPRPYRLARNEDAARAELLAEAGRQFDPACAEQARRLSRAA
jgi:putative nucleotidyltransferase with HDIG domain